MEGGKQGGSLKKSKKDKVAGGTGKAACIEGNTVSAAPRVKPELTLPVMYYSESKFIFPTLFFCLELLSLIFHGILVFIDNSFQYIHMDSLSI